jgi:glycosyltransferase involved in cell wall biosynthesis
VPPNPMLRKGRDYMVGYVGVMGEQEGIDLLLAAAAHLVLRLGRKDVQFCLVGGGPSLEYLQALAVRMGLAEYFTFLGRAPDRDLLEVLSTADVCVNPDRVNPMNDKSTMNKILEYMAVGKPIVQFEVTEGRVSAGDASLYASANDPVDLAQKIATLLSDPDRRAAMGRIGKERVTRELSWQHQVPALLEAYHALFAVRDVPAK